MTKLVAPYPLFLDGRGDLIDGGYIYIGAEGTDPEIEANQLDLYFDKALTIPAAQPLRTLGGMIVSGSNPVNIYFAEEDFATTIRDTYDQLVYYSASAFDTGGIEHQPLDIDLTAISALATTAFGRNLLTLANQAALQSAAGVGTAGLLPVSSVGQFRANTADKVLDTDCVWAAAISVPLTDAPTIEVDLSTGINFSTTLAGNRTLGSPTNVKVGQSGFIEFAQDATGNRTLNFASLWRFAGGTAPILSTAPNTRDLLHYQVLSDGLVYGALTKALS